METSFDNFVIGPIGVLQEGEKVGNHIDSAISNGLIPIYVIPKRLFTEEHKNLIRNVPNCVALIITIQYLKFPWNCLIN